jgi:hypothetical protein
MEGMATSYANNPGPHEVLGYFHSGLHTGRGPGLDDAVIVGFIREFSQEPGIADLVRQGGIVFAQRAKAGRMSRNTDLVIGPPGQPMLDSPSRYGMVRAAPATILLAADVKSIMTEHSKAQRNRRGDLEGLDVYMKDINPDMVTLGICVVNAADKYYSHTGKRVNDHGNGKERARRAITELDLVLRRRGGSDKGLDALCTPTVVVSNEAPYTTARWLTQPPAPGDGDELSWGHLIKRAASAYLKRAA